MDCPLPEAVQIGDEVKDESVDGAVLLVGDAEGGDLVAIVSDSGGGWHVEVMLSHVVVAQVPRPKVLKGKSYDPAWNLTFGGSDAHELKPKHLQSDN